MIPKSYILYLSDLTGQIFNLSIFDAGTPCIAHGIAFLGLLAFLEYNLRLSLVHAEIVPDVIPASRTMSDTSIFESHMDYFKSHGSWHEMIFRYGHWTGNSWSFMARSLHPGSVQVALSSATEYFKIYS